MKGGGGGEGEEVHGALRFDCAEETGRLVTAGGHLPTLDHVPFFPPHPTFSLLCAPRCIYWRLTHRSA